MKFTLPPFLKSRKFWALIAGALVIVVRQYVPDLLCVPG